MRDVEYFLPYSTPEREGVSSRVLLNLCREWRKLDTLNSFILIRHGHVIAEHYYAPYRADVPHALYSLTKSFTSLAIGYAEQEGLLSLDDPAIRFFPNLKPNQDRAKLEKVTVKHLLTMSGGHDACPLLSTHYDELYDLPDYAQVFFDAPFVYKPGEKFLYNSAGTHILAAIIRQLTGMNFSEYLKPRLLEPLKIRSFTVEKAPDGVEMGGWGGSARTRDLAKLGQCILQNGVWEGKQIIPADYLKRATSFQMDNSANDLPDWKVGYGYQFWQSRHGFRGDGACGQYILVLPKEDMTVAITAGMGEMSRSLDLLWEILLPSLYDAPRADKPEDQAALAAYMEQEMNLPLCPGDRTRRMMPRTFSMQENPSGIRKVTVSADVGEARLLVEGSYGTELLRAGFGYWVENPLKLFSRNPHIVEASAAWQSENVLQIDLVLIDSPYRISYTLDMSNGLVWSRKSNLLFLNPDTAPLRGNRPAGGSRPAGGLKV